ncbi:WGR domain-containing protein [Rhizobium freirei]|nr:WGR domain-containing protein [Rhizobium freirei]
MLAQPYHLYIERTDATKNMARFYSLSIEPTLFGTPCLTRRWGRIGSGRQSMAYHFDRKEEAVAMFLDLLWTKRARGDVVFCRD